MYLAHEDDKIRNKVYWGELPSSPPTVDPEQGAMEATMDTEPDRERFFSPDLVLTYLRLREGL